MAKELTSTQIAKKRWEKNNPERSRYLKNRTSARTFVRRYAVDDDVIQLLDIYMKENKNSTLFEHKLSKYLKKN